MYLKDLIKNKIIISKEKELVGSNILITNYCNQNCSFCFASELMQKGKTKEISLNKYKKLLDYLEIDGSKKVSLMGGEPTLHTNFKQIIKLTIDRGFEIDLFTNGQFSENISDFLKGMKRKIRMYHINIASPAYKIKKTHDEINRFIEDVSEFSLVALETTIGTLNRETMFDVFNLAKPVLDKSYIRIGVDGNLVTSGGFSLNKNREIGSIILDLTKYLFDNEIKGLWLAEINPCMFKESDIQKLENNPKINWKGYGCFSKNGGVDIKTDLKVIRCFGQDCLEGKTINKNDTLKKIKKNLDKEMIIKSESSLPIECSLCKYHGYKKGNCPGSCLIGR